MSEPEPPSPGIPESLLKKPCPSCGHAHTLETWRVLPLRGVQLFEDDADGRAALFEQRRCPCGHVLHRPIERGDPGLWDLLAHVERERLAVSRRLFREIAEPHKTLEEWKATTGPQRLTKQDHHQASRDAWTDWDQDELERELYSPIPAKPRPA